MEEFVLPKKEPEVIPLQEMFEGELKRIVFKHQVTLEIRSISNEIALKICVSIPVTAYCEMDPISSQQNVQLLPLSQSDKWLTSARLLNMVTLTTTDTGLAFFKFRKRALSYDEYLTYLEDLATLKNLDLEALKHRMQTCGKPRKTT